VEEPFEDHGMPLWDTQRAESLVGQYVLIGMTYLDPDGNVMRKSQLHGTIVEASQSDGIGIELGGQRSGEMFRLPPDLRAFERAAPGEYSLKATDEIVTDPDLLSTWTIQQPAHLGELNDA
jgi:hypothetical protein